MRSNAERREGRDERVFDPTPDAENSSERMARATAEWLAGSARETETTRCVVGVRLCAAAASVRRALYIAYVSTQY